jgi:hypothetical protein
MSVSTAVTTLQPVAEIPDSIQGDQQAVAADPQLFSDLRPHLDPLAAAEIPDPFEDDRQAVAARIRNLRAQTNLNEKRVAIGREYKAHRDRLRRNSRHDRDRDGWHAEFTKPSPFEDSRRGAEIHIQWCEAFGHLGSMLPRLPHGFRALQVLVTLKLSDAEIKSRCLSGEISPSSTEGAIWKLGAELGKVQAKPAIKKKSKKPGRIPAIPDFIWSWTHTPLEKRRENFDEIGAAGVREAMSAGLCAELRDDALRQNERVNPNTRHRKPKVREQRRVTEFIVANLSVEKINRLLWLMADADDWHQHDIAKTAGIKLTSEIDSNSASTGQPVNGGA